MVEYGAFTCSHSIIPLALSNLSFFSYKKFRVLDKVSKVGMRFALYIPTTNTHSWSAIKFHWSK